MPIVNYQQYCHMLDNAKQNKFAYPAINTTSSETINAALLAFKEANSDGIIQVSTGGGSFASGLGVGESYKGAIALAEFAHVMAAYYDVNIALHTDHCHPEYVDPFLMPLIQETAKRRAKGLPNLFSSHMYDGSALPMAENIAASKKIMADCVANDLILEIETGVVGGEEDGHDTSGVKKEKLYTTPEDMVLAAKELGSMGRFLLAATFGNVHGVYKPGNVVLKPTILKDGQEAVAKALGADTRLDLVFHGGSGSELKDIHEALDYGVVKMNVDTDTQYAYTRPVADHMMKNYDGVLKIEGEVGNKKVYDPRSWGKKAERGMADRIMQACRDLRSEGTSLGKNI
ncbi:class II fructose-bisphosphate aldolase [Desulfobacter hydrogenophilus]|uniref:Fructose-bisphosphate aldolase n=1 Tax=Desulfobacter hydrogenophilus TaxID=2291 RepID=A0A328FHU7_9BACT|nr:class II fructose-bisphosphate aldolase [Desulfobacter hydrogenophilus]NDY71498.1 class II fructose-bisphosphate aldolase [Desulfobacter hydrogenophilus]QBH11882.1 class II fructose-bisphosphate aldolase [Desulfobacter hydrogenophilus]RAM02525.1 class II fructose-bisphosphate aldolase [Desulfobacter hydrogenophilus]